MTHADSKESHSDTKYRKHNEKMFGFFYTVLLMSIGISMSIYGTATDGSSEQAMGTKIYYIFIYMSSIIIIVFLWSYLFVQRKKTYEALIKGENGSFQLILSKKGEKVNMYLRVGLALFGLCSLFYIFIATYIRSLKDDYKASFIVHGLSQALFIICMTIFILIYHRLVTLVHKNLMKFALMHLTIANMLMWANASIGKVSSEFESNAPCNETKYTNVCMICVYLLPTVSEYAVITAAILHEVYLRIGKKSLIELDHKETKRHTFVECSKTLPGIICGGMLVLGCIISAVISVWLHLRKEGEDWIFHFHSSQMIVLNILGIVILGITFRKIREMKFSVSLTRSSLDKNILYVSYILLINFCLIVLIISGKFVQENSNHFLDPLKLRLVSAIFEIIQSSLQTKFIIECFQRCSYDSKQKEKKTGRNCFAILLGINFGMWFLWTLQIKNADIIYHKENNEYNFILGKGKPGMLLLFFLQTTLPMGMLYRYHSSACLSDIYSKIYQTESERFVNHLRSGKLPNDTAILAKESTNHKSNIVSFSNVGYESDHESVASAEVPYKKRSQSAGIIPFSVLKEVNKKMMRRATLKNMQEAQYKFESEQISHQMLHRKMSPEAALPKSMKNIPRFPNVHRMLREGILAMNIEVCESDYDSDSAYSI